MADGGTIEAVSVEALQAQVAKLTKALARAKTKGKRTMPAQKPGKSEQVVGTPRDFLDAVEARFGELDWDLAANETNCVVQNVDGGPSRFFFGEEENSLRQNWGDRVGLNWCNPPFDDIAPWVKKAAEEASPIARVLMLTPASVDANWWWDFVRPHAVTYAVAPRLTFVGHDKPYPKGLSLLYFGLGATGFGRFRWKEGRK